MSCERLTQPVAAPDLIFISIASYRDPQLWPTVQDCLGKAAHPERLRFGICWQHGAETLPQALFEDERFRVLDVAWRDSRGPCWARAAIMQLWLGERWFLQIDSHCRFAAGWDDLLIDIAGSLDQPRIVLSTYAAPFVPGDEELLQPSPLQIALQGFTPEGIPYMKPLAIPNVTDEAIVRKARFLSAGFLFAPGTFVEEVPYDPGLYFLGEEVAMTVRAYTQGYDLFHPLQTIVWHDYVRADATKHWDDHCESKDDSPGWGDRDRSSKERVRRLLAGESLEAFNLGTVRTLANYETYAGLSFRARRAQGYTMSCLEPPNPPVAPDWADHIYPWMVRIVVRSEHLAREAMNDAAFWYVGVHDDLGNEIFRRDLTRQEVQALPVQELEIVLVCELQSGVPPSRWTIWPVSRSHGWLPKLEGQFADRDIAVLCEESIDAQQ